MQTCSECNAKSPDSALFCTQCNAELPQNTTQLAALKKYQENDRVKYVHLIASDDSCPACREFAGAYEKDGAPPLPIEACSHEYGCRCFYLPFLTEIYP